MIHSSISLLVLVTNLFGGPNLQILFVQFVSRPDNVFDNRFRLVSIIFCDDSRIDVLVLVWCEVNQNAV